MTVFGDRIAAARGDGTVGIYDSISGAQRLSVNPTDPIRALGGSPDGSTLFCIHRVPLVTLWDIQTGGLIHTFVLDQRVETIAISSNGRYLAGGLSDGSVKIWEVANKMEGAGIGSGSPVTHLCWLEPEHHLVVMGGALVRIWDTGVGKLLHQFNMHEATRGLAYSQKLNRLAILTTTEARSTITIIYPHTGTHSPYIIRHQLTCFTFSQTAEELVCGMTTPGLRWFDLSTLISRPINHPTTITSLSTLSNGTVVANTMDSGIQFLNLDVGYPQSEHPTVPALTVRPFDAGRVLAITSTDRDSTTLLDSASMSPLFMIPARKSGPVPEDRTAILCASQEHHMVVDCFGEGGRKYLQFWRIRGRLPDGEDDEQTSRERTSSGAARFLNWTVEVDELPLVGEISPTGGRLVTYHGEHHQAYICTWITTYCELLEKIFVDPLQPAHPLEITFEQDDGFYIQNDTDRIVCSYCPPFQWVAPGYTITRAKRPPGTAPFQRCYDVDDAREWVVRGSKKICWIPPGYIRSGKSSYCWVGHSLVMVGQDGTLRKLTFREQL